MEALAEEWAKAVAARAGRDQPRTQRRRPADRRPRPRPDDERPREGVALLRHRGPSQALPELQHAFDAKHCRRCGHPYAYELAFVGHLGHYSCPNCGAARPRPEVAATRIELRGMEGSRVDGARARRRDRGRAPPPRPLQRLQRAGGDRRGDGWVSPPERIAAALREMRAAFGRVETIAVGEAPVSILLIKNPAGANEVLRTLRLEAERRSEIDLWIALNDRIADGRDVSWVWDADFELLAGRGAPRRLRRDAGAGDGAAAEVRGLARGPDRGRARHRDLARRGGRRRRGPPLRPAHLHRAAGAAQAARRPRSRKGVLAVSAEATRGQPRPASGDLARRRVRRLRRRPAASGRSSPTARRPDPRARLRHRPGRDPPCQTRAPGDRARLRPRPDRRPGASVPPACRSRRCSPTLATSNWPSVRPSCSRRCSCFSCSPDRAERLACLRCDRRAAAARRPRRRWRSSRACRSPRRAAALLPDVREVDGWVYSSLPLEAGRRRSTIVDPPPAPDASPRAAR